MDSEINKEFKEMVEKHDFAFKDMEDVASFSAELDAIEEYLDLTAPEIQRALNTVDRAKANLKKQKELEDTVRSFLFLIT